MDFIQLLQLLGWPRLHRATKVELGTPRGYALDAGSDILFFPENGDSEDSTISPGMSPTGRKLAVGLDDFLGHGLILGATGSGKTCAAQSLFQQLAAFEGACGFGIIDPKGDLFRAGLSVVESSNLPDKEAWILDLSDLGSVIPYDILKPRAGEHESELLARRMETFADILGREGQLSLRMHRMLRFLVRLLVEYSLSFASLERLMDEPEFACVLAAKSKNDRARKYFREDFPKERSVTLPALRYRLDHLVARDNVRLSLSTGERPDFRELMDEGNVILVNVSGAGPAAARVFHSLTLSDLRQATFARRRPERPFIWFIDEAQKLFQRESDKENLSTLLRMSRSFGVHLVLMTQSLRSALGDGEFYQNLETNFRWLLLLRSGPADAAILRPGLRITGQVQNGLARRGRVHYLTPLQEIQHLLQEIANLPAREGYFWLRGSGARAVRLRTHRVRSRTQRLDGVGEDGELAGSVRKRLEEEEIRLKGLRKPRSEAADVEAFLGRVETEYSVE